MPKVKLIEPKKPDQVRVMVREAMARSDMRQTDLAKALKMTPQGVAYSLKNPGSITVDKLRKIAKVTGSQLVIRLEATS